MRNFIWFGVLTIAVLAAFLTISFGALYLRDKADPRIEVIIHQDTGNWTISHSKPSYNSVISSGVGFVSLQEAMEDLELGKDK